MSKIIATSLFAVVALGATVVSQSTQVAPADLVLRGGKIVTLDAQTPEGTALASRNGAVVAVGTDAAIARYIGPSTQVIDLAGRLAIPGFIAFANVAAALKCETFGGWLGTPTRAKVEVRLLLASAAG